MQSGGGYGAAEAGVAVLTGRFFRACTELEHGRHTVLPRFEMASRLHLSLEQRTDEPHVGLVV